MKIKKILFILLFPFMAEFAISCCSKCEYPLESGLYTYESLLVAALDNSSEHLQLSTSNKITKQAYGIRLYISRNQLVHQKMLSNGLFTQSAFALSCQPCMKTNLNPKDSIVAIQVISINEFNGSHLASSDVTEYFKFLEQNNYSTIPQYLNQMQQHVDDLFNLDLVADLMLTVGPAIAGQYGFEVILTLSDGRTLSQTIYSELT